jgi:uncharacterized repeat protein (TIGR01451 family)
MSIHYLYRIVWLMLLLTAVFALTPKPVSPQTPSPPRSRSIEELERWPEAGVTSQNESQGLSSLPGAGPDYVFDWSKRVFQSFFTGSGSWDIYLQDGSSEMRIISDGSHDIHPRLNRGTTHLVFSSNREGVYEIYSTNLNPMQIVPLTSTGSNNINPIWSPDSSKIAFQSYRDGQSEIYVMNADGSVQMRLTNHPEFDGMPTWSPDGSKIAFASRRSGGYRIYVMNADGSNVTQLSSQPYSANPTWSPDGMRIAYDADLDGDGWQELWLMSADGSNQRLLYDPPGQTDAWARSWSPDNTLIAYTLISFIYYQGNWYWVDAYQEAANLAGQTTRLSANDTAWNPDWQTADIIPPVSTLVSLPAHSTYQFALNWSGQDMGVAGLQNYDLEYKIGTNGNWTNILDHTTNTYYEFLQGIGGQTHYFRLRARDRAGNIEAWDANKVVFTTVEGMPPYTTVTRLKPFTRASEGVVLHWTGFDPGGSGIAEYNTQYRINNGSWVDWETVSDGPISIDNPTAGQTYHFRIRGVDRAQNKEAWAPGNGNTSTTVYSAAVTGLARDNSGTPVQALVVTTSPASLQTITGDNDGRYAAYLATNAGSYTVNWSKNGYGPLPTTTFATTTDAQLPIILPPANNIVHNSGFETGSLEPHWLPDGTLPPVLTETVRNTGQYAVLLGQFDQPFNDGFALGNSNVRADVAVGKDNAVHIAWNHGSDLFYRQRSGTGSWATSQLVANNAIAGSSQLAVDDNNTVHLLWIGSDAIRYAQRPNGGSWSTPEVVYTGTASYPAPQMEVAGNGIVHVIWHANYEAVFYRRRTTGGGWTTAQAITSSTLPAKLAVDGNGTAHVIWTATVASGPGHAQIIYMRHPVGGSWSTPLNISKQPQSHSTYPQIIVGANGVVHVTWDHAGDSSLYHTSRDTNGVWSTPYGFSYNFGNSLSDLTLDNSGNLDIVYGVGWRHIRRHANGTWSLAKDLYPYGQANVNHVYTAIDKSGLAHVVYQEQSDPYLAYYSRQTGSSWTTPLALKGDPASNTYFDPQMGLDNYGQPHIIWRSAFQNLYYSGLEWATTADTSELSQLITIPVEMPAPTLSFLYQANGIAANTASQLSVELDNGVTKTVLLNLIENRTEWSHYSADLTPWSGQAVTLTFRLAQATGTPLVSLLLDEVTIGSAHPDVWVTGSSTAALRNEQTTHTLTYGNRGGAPAAGARITYTLPAHLSFVSASVTPISTSPLVWDLGALPAKSNPLSLTVTVQVSATAPAFQTLTSTAVIQTTTSELEKANNSGQAFTYIGRFTYLPLIFR